MKGGCIFPGGLPVFPCLNPLCGFLFILPWLYLKNFPQEKIPRGETSPGCLHSFQLQVACKTFKCVHELTVGRDNCPHPGNLPFSYALTLTGKQSCYFFLRIIFQGTIWCYLCCHTHLTQLEPVISLIHCNEEHSVVYDILYSAFSALCRLRVHTCFFRLQFASWNVSVLSNYSVTVAFVSFYVGFLDVVIQQYFLCWVSWLGLYMSVTLTPL